MILVDIFALILRIAELAFAAIVAGITGHYLHSVHGSSSWSQGRFIYTEVVAGLSILLSIIWLFPFSGSFIHWPADIVISICWFVAFGLIVNWLGGSCGNTFDWSNVGFSNNDCSSWKSDEAFAFLSAICWLVSALLGIYWVSRHRRSPGTAADGGAYTTRRRWYRSSRV